MYLRDNLEVVGEPRQKRRVAPKHFTVSERLAFHSKPGNGGCINWTAGCDEQGYGFIFVGGKQRRAHRIAYEEALGPIPDGLVIDHLCRNPSCIAVQHLEAVTVRENTMRGASPYALAAAKTQCLRGHPLSGENLTTDHRGHRKCRACANIHTKKHRETHPQVRDFKAEWERRKDAVNAKRREHKALERARAYQAGLS